jgi:hypothetical protein
MPMRDLRRDAIQDVFRAYPWTFHLVLGPGDVMRLGDRNAISKMKELNYRLCKRWLRRFSRLPLDKRFHWAAFFQGSRELDDRHLHVLLYVPASVPFGTPMERLKVKYSIEDALRRVTDRDCTPELWKRRIKDDADNKAAATYVSRELTRASWETEDVHFSQ